MRVEYRTEVKYKILILTRKNIEIVDNCKCGRSVARLKYPNVSYPFNLINPLTDLIDGHSSKFHEFHNLPKFENDYNSMEGALKAIDVLYSESESEHEYTILPIIVRKRYEHYEADEYRPPQMY